MDYAVTSGLNALKYLFWCIICPLVHFFFTLLLADTSRKRTLTLGPVGVRLREVRLYMMTLACRASLTYNSMISVEKKFFVLKIYLMKLPIANEATELRSEVASATVL